MKQLLYILILFSYSLTAQTVYIDPTAPDGGDGSITTPFNDWDNDISFTNGYTYRQKRGTSITNLKEILVEGKFNVKIGAYGAGDVRPIIHNSIGQGIIKFYYSSRCTVDSMELIGDVNVQVFGVYASGYYAAGSNDVTNITVSNCIIHDMYNGYRSLPYSTNNDTTSIINCEIYNTMSDGIFIQQSDCTNIRNSHIYKVNMAWHLVAGSHPNDNLSEGDGIQLALGMPRWSIKNTIIDRRYTGNKFCIIYNTGGALTTGRGLVEGCTLYPPKDTIDGDGGAGIFLKWGYNITFRNNKFLGNGYPGGVDDHVMMLSSSNMDTINFYGNLFNNIHNLSVGTGVTHVDLINNTFANSNDFGGQKTVICDAPAIEKNNVYAIQSTDITTQFNGGATSTTNHTIKGSSSTWMTDPGFVSTSNFNLLTGSVLKDAGTNDGKVVKDLNGTSRPQNGKMDIGAYEYSFESIPVSGTKNLKSKGNKTYLLKGKTLTIKH